MLVKAMDKNCQLDQMVFCELTRCKVKVDGTGAV